MFFQHNAEVRAVRQEITTKPIMAYTGHELCEDEIFGLDTARYADENSADFSLLVGVPLKELSFEALYKRA